MKNPADTAVEMLREIAGESRATDKKKLLVALAATIENELSRLRAAADNAGHALVYKPDPQTRGWTAQYAGTSELLPITPELLAAIEADVKHQREKA